MALPDYTKYKDLFLQLTQREIKAKYKQSILGYAWVILVPLINLVVLNFVFSYFFRVPTGDIPYAAFLFVGLVPWGFTANAISAATSSIVGNSSLITKVKFPREIIPMSAITSKIVDFLLVSVIMVFFLLYYQIPFHLTLLFLPLIFLIQLALVTGISFILSSFNVFFRDVENILGVILTVWMYLTPVIYPPEMIPESIRPILSINPMVGIINAYRNVVLHGVMPPWNSFLFSVVISVLLLIIGYIIFKRKEKAFADVI